MDSLDHQKKMQDQIACNFARNMGMPYSAHENDDLGTLKQIYAGNHVFKCRCQREVYLYANECVK